jgi:DNA-binding NarL/FixJ family response regulator
MDLSMPVMNGFDGCKKINKFFKTDREVKLTMEDKVATILLEALKPVIVACTSESINNEILKKNISDVGFEYAIETPLTMDKVRYQLAPLIDLRK